ncbi:RnfABCDGE type electron transport complex subunit G [Litorivicinus sp.]|nr:RnfABCDGE type electron transport complex subunit G [Litorivicinus sp.]
MIVRLMLFGLITSLFVGLVYVVTKPVIIEAKEQARQEKLYLLAAPLLANGRIASPVQRELPDDAPASFENPLSITPIVTDVEQLGVVLPITAVQGYSGPIQLLLALDQQQRIVGVRAIEHRETPGLGDQIETRKSDWMLAFNGLRYDDLAPDDWAVQNDGGQFDSFTGATITPRAVVDALKETLAYLARHPVILEANP